MNSPGIIDEIKSRARGRWRTIYAFLARCDSSIFDGKHHPCPKCEGKDRFRFTDMNGDGSLICNQCGRDIGDGIAGLEWLNGEDTKTTLRLLADHLQIGKPATNRNHATNDIPAKPAPVLNSPSPSDDFEKQFYRWDSKCHNLEKKFGEFASKKPPITVDAITESGAIVCTWPASGEHGKQCIAWPAFSNPGELTGYILRRVDGQEFAEYGSLSARKTHMLRGSHDGWVIPGGFDRVAKANVVWRVEGIPDALALFPFLPADHAVITNICGAGSVKDLNLEILRGKKVCSIGDADEPGQEGAVKFATAAARFASDVRVVGLPYEIDPSHGRDVRDFLTDGNTFEQLMVVADSASPVTPSAEETSQNADAKKTTGLTIRAAGELIREFPQLRESIIEGLIRRGETMNIIAPPKTGKSWLVMCLALAVATGQKWFGRFWTKPGKVLIIDNELHPESTAHRLPRIAEAMGIRPEEYADRLFVTNLRGQLIDLKALAAELLALPPDEYSLIVLDAWYRFQPEGSDENSNSDVSALYNLLDSVAAAIGCAFVCIHHTSKGNQSGKGITDVGSGAGAQSRAPDAHLVMRQHEQDGVVVVDAAVRSFAPMDSFCLEWNFPIWTSADDFDPKNIRQDRPRRKPKAADESNISKEEQRKQSEADRRTKILEAYRLNPDGESATCIRDAAGVSGSVFGSMNANFLRDGVVVRCKVEKNGRKIDGFKLAEFNHPDKPDNSEKSLSGPGCPVDGEIHTRTAAPPLGAASSPGAPQIPDASNPSLFALSGLSGTNTSNSSTDPLWLPPEKPNGGQPA